MTCDNCDMTATVHLTEIRGGKKFERHLCVKCAASAAGLPSNEDAPISELLTKFVLEHTKGRSKQPPE